MSESREVWDPVDLSVCGVCGKEEPRNGDEETRCEEIAHHEYLVSIYGPDLRGYNGTY